MHRAKPITLKLNVYGSINHRLLTGAAVGHWASTSPDTRGQTACLASISGVMCQEAAGEPALGQVPSKSPQHTKGDSAGFVLLADT